jgi:hypothetical protein
MNRRNFLRLIPVTTVAIIVAPEILAKRKSVWGPKVETELKNRLSTLRNDYFIGCDPATGQSSIVVMKARRKGYTWIQQAEWQFHKDWKKQMEIEWMKYNCSMINIQSYIK